MSKIARGPLEEGVVAYEALMGHPTEAGALGQELSIYVGAYDVVAFGGDMEGAALWIARYIKEDEWPPKGEVEVGTR